MKEADPTKSNGENEKNSRREFLQKVGVGSILLGAGATGFQTVRALIPDVLYEASERFKVGHPTQLSEGVTFIEDRRLYVFKEGRSYYAISGACTHLGCTVRKEPSFFRCPCHGSTYSLEGSVVRGPAEKALERYPVQFINNQLTILFPP